MPPLGVPTIRYIIADGLLTVGGVSWRGYAGRAEHRDQPGSVDRVGLGPLPPGVYRIGEPRHHPRLGPLSIPLTAIPGSVTHGRSGFYIHGDNARGDRSASSGCIVVGRAAREAVVRAMRRGIVDLVVIPS